MTSRDVELLRYRYYSDSGASLRRARSEGSLIECGLEETSDAGLSMLKLSKTRISVADSVTVYWDIREACGANDWIGLYDLGKLEVAE